MKTFTEAQLKNLLIRAWKDGFSKAVENETGFPSDQSKTSRYADNSPQTVERMNRVCNEIVKESSKFAGSENG